MKLLENLCTVSESFQGLSESERVKKKLEIEDDICYGKLKTEEGNRAL